MNPKKISPVVFAKASSDMTVVLSLRGKIELPKKLKKIRSFPFISSIAVNGAFSDIVALSSKPAVARISAALELSFEENYSAFSYANGNDCNPEENAFFAPSSGGSVAVLDSGVNYHLDLSSFCNRIKKRHSVISSDPSDENGHGTMIAGLIGGNGLLSRGKYGGITRECDIVSVKCMKKDGRGDSLDILSGMQWIYDNAEKYKIKVVSMAFGATYQGAFDPLAQGVEALFKKGIVCVTAAGNDPSDGVKSPGVSPFALTVGSFEECGGKFKRASFSAFSESLKKPDFLFRGVDVCAPSFNGKYAVFSGTSVSCGIASGLSLYIAQNIKNFNLSRLKRVLYENSFGEKPFERIINLS